MLQNEKQTQIFYNDFSVFLTLFKTPSTIFGRKIWRCDVITIVLYEFFCTMLKNRKICKVGHPLTVWCDIACFSQALPCRVCKTVLECRRLVLVTSRILLRPHGIFQALFLASYFFKPSWESEGDEGSLAIWADYLVSENTGFNGSSGAYTAYMLKYK